MDRSCDIGQLNVSLGFLHVVVAKVNLVDVERIIVALAQELPLADVCEL